MPSANSTREDCTSCLKKSIRTHQIHIKRLKEVACTDYYVVLLPPLVGAASINFCSEPLDGPGVINLAADGDFPLALAKNLFVLCFLVYHCA